MSSDENASFIIRQAQPGDAGAFNAAVGAVARERRYLALLDAKPLADTEAFLSRTLAAGFPVLVATVEEAVVGWCAVTRRSERAVFAHAASLVIGVVAGFRGRGLGRRLLSESIEQAWRFGFDRIELSVRADNERALALYRLQGFAAEGRTTGSFRVDGIDYDEIQMALLRPGFRPSDGRSASEAETDGLFEPWAFVPLEWVKDEFRSRC